MTPVDQASLPNKAPYESRRRFRSSKINDQALSTPQEPFIFWFEGSSEIYIAAPISHFQSLLDARSSN